MSEPIIHNVTPDNYPSKDEMYAMVSTMTGVPASQLRRVAIVAQIEIDGQQGLMVAGEVGNKVEAARFLNRAANSYMDQLADEMTHQILSGLDPATATPLDFVKRFTSVMESHEMQGMEIPDDISELDQL